MKTWKLFWGLGFILAALLIILDSLGVIAPFTEAVGGVSVGAIIIGIFLISFVISRISKGKICEIFFPLAILFLIFEKNIATLAGLEDKDIISGGAVILVALLLTVGTAILFPFRVKAKIHIEGSSEGKKSFGRKKRAENSLSVSTVYIDSDSMTPSHIENSIGSCSVYFEKTECYVGGGCITVENNLGSMQINVPAEWIAECETENNLGSVSVAETKNSTGPVINISIENNLGSVSVRYV